MRVSSLVAPLMWMFVGLGATGEFWYGGCGEGHWLWWW